MDVFAPRTRYSIYELQILYEKGTTKPLEDVMRAWRGIKSLDPKDPRSFFNIASYHGMPFRGEGRVDDRYWGGYCAHGNVLFPTWHRVYVLKLEEALRSIPGCSNVTLPYWDQTEEHALKHGIPWPLTREKFTLDGEEIDNPLRSYILQEALIYPFDPKHGYTKPEAYETKRYPLAALVGTPEDIATTDDHNKQFQDYEKNVELLNTNVTTWMHVQAKKEYENCLEAPNYTVFSNTTSARAYNKETQQTGKPSIIPLESPHNHLHLAVGGFIAPNKILGYNFIKDSSGDMGENETAAFDPIFYFHHCNIDRVFWLWQRKHKSTTKLEILEGYGGTSTNDDQGPTPGYNRDQTLGLYSPLYPFTRIQNGMEVSYTSYDVVNIEEQLGYTYSKGSLEDKVLEKPKLHATNEYVKKVCVSNLGKDQIKGSFLVECYLPVGPDDVRFLGVASVLSRWNLKACSNCQKHLDLEFFFDLPDVPGLKDPKPYAKIISRFGDTETGLLQSSPEGDKIREIEKNLVYHII